MIPPCLISSLPLVLFFFSSVAFVVNAYTVEKSFLFFFFTWTACTEFARILFTRTQRKEKENARTSCVLLLSAAT